MLAMITLYLRARTTDRRALEDFLADAAPVYEAPGGITVRLQWSQADPSEFLEVIEYADQAGFDADNQRVATDPAMIALLHRWHTLLEGSPSVSAFTEVPIARAPSRAP